MGVGGKRSRGVGARGRAPQPDGGTVHAAPLGDEVRETRDPEFAAARRAAKRARVAAAQESGVRRPRGAPGRGGSGAAGDDDEDGDGNVADERISRKILGEARRQREEVREEEIEGFARVAAGEARVLEMRRKLGDDVVGGGGGGGSSASGKEDDVDSESDEEEEYVEVEGGGELTAADELAIAMFTAGDGEEDEVDLDEGGGEAGGRVMLADVILAKIREKADADAAAAQAAADPEAAAREQKIQEVYGLVGNILSRYKSGRIPKAFKVIPKLRNWEDLMYLTRPDEWSPAAMYAATRIFASNLKANEVVVFYQDVLLPAVLEDISENKKLNYHLYRALKKAVYKPDAFNKGILFPLCERGGCSLREATIIGSVLSRVSIPMLHSAAALLFIAEQPYAVSNSVFIHALLNKKYALPYRVIDALVMHFTRMKNDARSPPICWHISLLTFARRYKTEMEARQKDELKVLMRVQTHAKVTPEIRRELFSARCRGEAMDPDANTIARAIANAC